MGLTLVQVGAEIGGRSVMNMSRMRKCLDDYWIVKSSRYNQSCGPPKLEILISKSAFIS